MRKYLILSLFIASSAFCANNSQDTDNINSPLHRGDSSYYIYKGSNKLNVPEDMFGGRIKVLGGRIILDGSVELTGAVQVDKYFYFTAISTPTAPAANHAKMFMSKDASLVCTEYSSGFINCFSGVAFSTVAVVNITAGLGLTGGGSGSNINLYLSTPIANTFIDNTFWLTTSSATATYLQLSSASATYLQQSSATANYLNTALAASTYLTQSSATATYLQQSSATATYLQLSSATATYLQKSSATVTYGNLIATQTWSGDNLWRTPGISTFTYGVKVGSLTIGNLTNTLLYTDANGIVTSTSVAVGSGTVNTGVIGHVAYYASNTNAVSDGGSASVQAGTLALSTGAALFFDGSNAMTIIASNPSISEQYTLPDIGNDTTFDMIGGTQTVSAQKTYNHTIIISTTIGLGGAGTTGSSGQFLTSQGGTTTPSWTSVNATTYTWTAQQTFNNTVNISTTIGLNGIGNVGTSGQVLTSQGISTIPIWATPHILQLPTMGTVAAASSTVVSSTFVPTNLNVSITPTLTSSKVLVLSSGFLIQATAAKVCYMTIARDGINLGKSSGFVGVESSAGDANAAATAIFLDSPNTTSSVNYKIYIKTDSGGTCQLGTANNLSVIIAIEVN